MTARASATYLENIFFNSYFNSLGSIETIEWE